MQTYARACIFCPIYPLRAIKTLSADRLSVEAIDILILTFACLVVGFITLAFLAPWYIRRLERKERELLSDPQYLKDQAELGVKLSKETREKDR